MFEVEWIQEALDELAAIWTQAMSDERQAITAASHSVEQRLQADPHNEGESRTGRQRMTFVAPLAVTFQVEDDGQTVTVLHVRLYRRRKA